MTTPTDAERREQKIEEIARILQDRRGFGFSLDPNDGQDLADISMEALDNVRFVIEEYERASPSSPSGASVEKIARKLQEAYDRVCYFPEKQSDGLARLLELRNLVPQVIETLRAPRVRPSSQWRSIKEERPPEGEMFIYYEPRGGKRRIGLAYHAVGGGWRDSESERSRPLNPTHWMPLPGVPT